VHYSWREQAEILPFEYHQPSSLFTDIIQIFGMLLAGPLVQQFAIPKALAASREVLVSLSVVVALLRLGTRDICKSC
jgi:hypothetical protein